VLAGAGQHEHAAAVSEQAKAAALSITDPDRQAEALVRVAGALAGAGQHQDAAAVAEQAKATGLSITDLDRQAEALAQVAGALAEGGNTHSACQVAAAICAVGRWTTCARPVLLLDPSAYTTLARVLNDRWGLQLSWLRPFTDMVSRRNILRGTAVRVPFGAAWLVEITDYASWSMMRRTLRRSMLRSRAMARWLRPAWCQACTACSSVGPSASAGGAPCPADGTAWP
jgi:hypothetical protein